MELKELYSLQKDLDEEIAVKHNISYETTRVKRELALISEISELLNETRCFKYWSNKGPSPKAIVLDEYADVLHFFLSLGIDIGVTPDNLSYEAYNGDLSEGFLKLYKLTMAFVDKENLASYLIAFTFFLSLGQRLNFTEEDIINAYKKKMEVNHKRQENNY